MSMITFIATAPQHTMITSNAIPARALRTTCAHATYLSVLAWLFTLFNSVRVLAYMPTLWTIYTSADSSQHSLITWATWLGANITMAAWLYEQNGQRVNRAVAVNMGNTVMCLLTLLLILAYRT